MNRIQANKFGDIIMDYGMTKIVYSMLLYEKMIMLFSQIQTNVHIFICARI